MKIESIRLKNYKVFRDVHLKNIPSFLVVVGANGSGKSTLFDVFGFLHDCLKGTVRQALDKRGRFREVLSRDAEDETILIEIQYRMLITGVERLVTSTTAPFPLSQMAVISEDDPPVVLLPRALLTDADSPTLPVSYTHLTLPPSDLV